MEFSQVSEYVSLKLNCEVIFTFKEGVSEDEKQIAISKLSSALIVDCEGKHVAMITDKLTTSDIKVIKIKQSRGSAIAFGSEF